jgi:hypothetical protein
MVNIAQNVNNNNNLNPNGVFGKKCIFRFKYQIFFSKILDTVLLHVIWRLIKVVARAFARVNGLVSIIGGTVDPRNCASPALVWQLHKCNMSMNLQVRRQCSMLPTSPTFKLLYIHNTFWPKISHRTLFLYPLWTWLCFLTEKSEIF